MAKYENIRALAKKQLQAVTESSDRWKAFLRTAAIAYNYACGIKYDTHEGGKSMEMNSVMATEIVAAEVEHIVLPQIVSIKQASRMLGLPPYYLRRLCKEVPGVAFQSGIKWYINLGKLVDYYNNSGRNAAG